MLQKQTPGRGRAQMMLRLLGDIPSVNENKDPHDTEATRSSVVDGQFDGEGAKFPFEGGNNVQPSLSSPSVNKSPADSIQGPLPASTSHIYSQSANKRPISRGRGVMMEMMMRMANPSSGTPQETMNPSTSRALNEGDICLAEVGLSEKSLKRRARNQIPVGTYRKLRGNNVQPSLSSPSVNNSPAHSIQGPLPASTSHIYSQSANKRPISRGRGVMMEMMMRMANPSSGTPQGGNNVQPSLSSPSVNNSPAHSIQGPLPASTSHIYSQFSASDEVVGCRGGGQLIEGLRTIRVGETLPSPETPPTQDTLPTQETPPTTDIPPTSDVLLTQKITTSLEAPPTSDVLLTQKITSSLEAPPTSDVLLTQKITSSLEAPPTSDVLLTQKITTSLEAPPTSDVLLTQKITTSLEAPPTSDVLLTQKITSSLEAPPTSDVLLTQETASKLEAPLTLETSPKGGNNVQPSLSSPSVNNSPAHSIQGPLPASTSHIYSQSANKRPISRGRGVMMEMMMRMANPSSGTHQGGNNVQPSLSSPSVNNSPAHSIQGPLPASTSHIYSQFSASDEVVGCRGGGQLIEGLRTIRVGETLPSPETPPTQDTLPTQETPPTTDIPPTSDVLLTQKITSSLEAPPTSDVLLTQKITSSLEAPPTSDVLLTQKITSSLEAPPTSDVLLTQETASKLEALPTSDVLLTQKITSSLEAPPTSDVLLTQKITSSLEAPPTSDVLLTQETASKLEAPPTSDVLLTQKITSSLEAPPTSDVLLTQKITSSLEAPPTSDVLLTQETASKLEAPLTLETSPKEGMKDLLSWFHQPTTKAINLQYLTRHLNEPVFNTETLVDSFSPAQLKIRRYNIQLARLRLFLDIDSKRDILKILNDLDTDEKLDDNVFVSNCEKTLIDCYLFWFSTIANQMLGFQRGKPLLTTPASWADSYVKAAFYQLFSIKGCKKALIVLFPFTTEDSPSLENLELLFLKARILGKLRYLEQWPANRWSEEEDLLLHIVKHLPDLSAMCTLRVKVYLAEFLRLIGYRHFLEARASDPSLATHLRAHPKIERYYTRSFELLKALENPLREFTPIDGMAWHGEQLLKMPAKDEWIDIYEDIAISSLKHGLTLDTRNTYLHRVCALSMEKICNKHCREKMSYQQSWKEIVTKKEEDPMVKAYQDQALNHLRVAVENGSSVAQVEEAGFLYRISRRTESLELIKVLPDANLHCVEYNMLNRNKQRVAGELIQSVITRLPEYPPLLVYWPILAPLLEPINLTALVYTSKQVYGTRITGHLTHREEILGEAKRLETNKMFIAPQHKKHRTQRKQFNRH